MSKNKMGISHRNFRKKADRLISISKSTQGLVSGLKNLQSILPFKKVLDQV